MRVPRQTRAGFEGGKRCWMPNRGTRKSIRIEPARAPRGCCRGGRAWSAWVQARKMGLVLPRSRKATWWRGLPGSRGATRHRSKLPGTAYLGWSAFRGTSKREWARTSGNGTTMAARRRERRYRALGFLQGRSPRCHPVRRPHRPRGVPRCFLTCFRTFRRQRRCRGSRRHRSSLPAPFHAPRAKSLPRWHRWTTCLPLHPRGRLRG